MLVDEPDRPSRGCDHINRPMIDFAIATLRGGVGLDSLARSLFEEEEKLLPEGETWAELSETEKDFWRLAVKAVLRKLRDLSAG